MTRCSLHDAQGVSEPILFLIRCKNLKGWAGYDNYLFKRSGGFVGQGMRVRMDLAQLPAKEATYLAQLIERAEFFRLPESFIPKFNPEEFQYTITVDTDVECHTVRANDSTCPPCCARW